jgi:hypothetical protein
MSKKPLFVLIFFLTKSLLAQVPLVKQWDRRYGGLGLDKFVMFEQTRDGGYILGGSSASGNTGDKSQASWGNWDYWVVKLDSLGYKEWDKRFGGSSIDDFSALTQSHDGGFLICGTSYSPISGDKSQPAYGVTDFWIVKIDSVGSKVWDKKYGGDKRDHLNCLTKTTDNGFVLGGTAFSGISSEVTISNWDTTFQSGDYWIVKIDSAGNKLWDKRYGGLKQDDLTSIQQTADGGFILGGKSISGIGGDKTQSNWGSYDYWIVKIDSIGNKLWDKRYGTTSSEDLGKIIQSKDKGFVIIGGSPSGISHDKSDTCRGVYDNWVLKLDSAGNKEWDKTYGSTARDEIVNIIEAREGGFYISGDSYSPAGGEKTDSNLGYQCVWLLKIDPLGNILWDKTIQTYGENDIGYVIQTNDGSIVIADGNNSGIGGEKTQDCWDSLTPYPMMFYETDYWIIKYSDTSQYCRLGPITINAGNSLICAGDSIHICAPPDFTSYEWNNGELTSCIYINAAGNYYATVTDNNSCTAESNFVTVSVNPILQTSVSQNGDTLIAYGATIYQWYLNGVAINGATENVYIATEPGKYTVMFTDSNGCQAVSTSLLVTSVENAESDVISINPNPFTSEVLITMPVLYKANPTITITDIAGQIVYQQTNDGQNNMPTKVLDLSYLPNGFYFVAVTTRLGKVVKRVIKK